MTLVAGVDSSTQSCKVVVRDADTGALVRAGRAPHPGGTEIHPEVWWSALQKAIDHAGGLGDVAAVAVAAQQHGLICLDDAGAVVRPAMLWNDTRSAHSSVDLVAELGGGAAWAEAVGSVPGPSFTITKLRWLADHEPGNLARTAAICLPHDWLTWRLAGALRRGRADLDLLVTDRGDASGTGYWSPATGGYRLDLLEMAAGRVPTVPRVLGPAEPAGVTPDGLLLAPGTGDNPATALALGAEPGDVVVSIGTSGVASAVTGKPVADASGTILGFADATGRFLPLAATMNAARVLDAAARLLGVDHDGLARLAMSAPPGAGGVVLVPYLEGERTLDRLDATAAVHGLQLATATPAHVARAAVEGLLCGLAEALDRLVASGARVDRVLLVGGGARSEAVQQVAPSVLARPVLVPPPGEYAADGAARQAAWVLAGSAAPPQWARPGTRLVESDPVPDVRARYAEACELTLRRPEVSARSA